MNKISKEHISFFKHYISAIKSKLIISIYQFKSLKNDIDNPNNLNEFIFKRKNIEYLRKNHLRVLGV